MPDVLNITNIPAPRVEFIDPRTGLMSREWYRFFLNLFTLTGSGSNSTTLEDLQVESPYASEVASLAQVLANFSQSVEVQVADTKAQQALSSLADLTNLVNASALAPRYDAALDDLGDVSLTTPANNNVLSYYPSTRAWRNTDPGVLYAAAYGVSASNTAAQNSAAFATITAAGPGHYILPAGVIQVDSTLTLPSYQTWQGAGSGITTIKWTSIPATGGIESVSKTKISLQGLTLDNNSLASVLGIINWNNITDFYIDDLQIINMTKYGIAINNSDTGLVTNFEVIRNYKSTTQNQAVILSSSSTMSKNIIFSNGTCRNSGVDWTGEDIWFDRVSVYGWSFGAGFTAEQDSAAPSYNRTTRGGLINCLATDGTGFDPISGYEAGGAEIWGDNVTVIGFQAFANDGNGIDFGSKNGVLSSSTFINNGRGTTVGPLWSGISMRYGNATYNASGALVIGCRSFDSGAGTQAYGYEEQSASLSNITMKACSFIGNVTGPTNILSSSTVVDVTLSTTLPAAVGTAAIGTGTTAARSDHVHAHGAQAGGTTHADATTSVSGFMSGADKTKLDTLSNGTILSVSQSFAGATIGTGAIAAQSTTLTGVAFGDYIEVGFSFPLLNCTAMAFVTATNSVQCVFTNNTGASVTLASGTIYFRALKR